MGAPLDGPPWRVIRELNVGRTGETSGKVDVANMPLPIIRMCSVHTSWFSCAMMATRDHHHVVAGELKLRAKEPPA